MGRLAKSGRASLQLSRGVRMVRGWAVAPIIIGAVVFPVSGHDSRASTPVAVKLTYVGPQDSFTPSILLRVAGDTTGVASFRPGYLPGVNYLNDQVVHVVDCRPATIEAIARSLQGFPPVRTGARQPSGYLCVSALYDGRPDLQAFLDEDTADSVLRAIDQQLISERDAEKRLASFAATLGLPLPGSDQGGAEAHGLGVGLSRIWCEWEGVLNYSLVNVAGLFAAELTPTDVERLPSGQRRYAFDLTVRRTDEGAEFGSITYVLIALPTPDSLSGAGVLIERVDSRFCVARIVMDDSRAASVTRRVWLVTSGQLNQVPTVEAILQSSRAGS